MWRWPDVDDDPRDLVAPPGGPAATLALYASLRRSSRWDPERMRAWQLERADRVVAHARRHITLYREHLADAGPSPSFESLPTIDTASYRSRPRAEVLAGAVPKGSQRILTSGSTGQVLEVFYPPNHRRALGALKLRMDRARGLPLHGHRVTVAIGGGSGAGVPWRRASRRRNESEGLQPAEVTAARLVRERPAAVIGYANLLVDAAEVASEPIRPARLTTYGQQLNPATRDALRRLYGTEPLDTYGANEHGALAWQCEAADLYHVNAESVLIELLDDDGRAVPAGTPGHVVVTSLANPLMPFVRQRVGDLAVLATRPCRCGFAQPALASVAGRSLEWFHLPDGRRLAPEHLWMDVVVDASAMEPHVRRYQVRQHPDGSVGVRIATYGQPLPAAFAEEVRRGYERALGGGVPVSVEQVDDLAREPNGKFRLVGCDYRPASSRAS